MIWDQNSDKVASQMREKYRNIKKHFQLKSVDVLKEEQKVPLETLTFRGKKVSVIVTNSYRCRSTKRLLVVLHPDKQVKPKLWETVKCGCGVCNTCKHRFYARERRLNHIKWREEQKVFWEYCDVESTSTINKFRAEISDIASRKITGKLKAI